MHIQSLPLSTLHPSARNVRRTGAADVQDLVASIRQHGLLQNLIVLPGDDGQYQVIAGARRLSALKALADAGDLPEGLADGVPCQVLTDHSTDGELSLAENVIRAPMHPADQFEAFARLVDAGLSVGDVAARFGVKPVFVEQRLRLSRVAPDLLDIYRSGGMTLEQLEAFTLTEDHKAQVGYWTRNPQAWQRRPEEIRRGLTAGEIDLRQDKRGMLVGADALIAAGGQVRRDLFDSTGGFTKDAKLLDKLAMARLEAAADPVRAEGWSYVEVLPNWEDRHRRDRLEPARRKATAEENIELARLRQRWQTLDDKEDGLTDQEGAEYDALEEQITHFDDRLAVWTDKQKARAGAVVTIGRSGNIEIHRGYLKAGQKAARGEATGDAPVNDSAKAPKTTADLTGALSMRLAAHRTMALRAEVAARSDVGLVLVVHNLAGRVFYAGSASDLRIMIDGGRCGPTGLPLDRADERVDESPAAAEMKRVHTAWKARLPVNPSDLWAWLRDQPEATLLNLLAYCAACSVDATACAADPKLYAKVAADLAAAVDLDMAKWWTPTVQNFLGSVPKSVILGALRESSAQPIIDAEGLESFKADALAARAEVLLCRPGQVWLPPLLRSPKWQQGVAAAPDKPAKATPPATPRKPEPAKKPAAKAKAKAKPKAKAPAKSAPKKKAKR